MSEKPKFTRRSFLKGAGVVAGAATFGGAAISLAEAAAHQDHAAKTAQKGERFFRGRMFFTNELQFKTLSAAAERIFPKDETGPGAIDLKVPYFIDNQLAGAYGYNAREYITGPHAPGAPGQGYQTALCRKDVFVEGLAALNAMSQKWFRKDFPAVTPEQQDEILKMCEKGSIPTNGFTSKFFFGLLKDAVLAGVYADPIYAGNNNMDGWRMKQYPGAQMAYMDVIDSPKFDKIDPVSLADMQ